MTTRNPTTTSAFPTVRRGDPIEADLINRIASMAARAGRIRVGAGLTMRVGADGVVISIDWNQLRNRCGGWMDARISAVTGGSGPDVASAFTYAAIVTDRVADLPEFTGLTPAGGRPVRASDTTTEIYPCAAGDACAIRLRKNLDGTTTPELWVGTEVLAVEDCAAAAQSEPASLPLDDLIDQVLTGIDWSVLAGIRRELATTFLVNDAQTALYITPAVLGIDGEPAVGIDHTILTSFDADPDATDLWDAVAVTSDGHPIVGIDHTLTLSALI